MEILSSLAVSFLISVAAGIVFLNKKLEEMGLEVCGTHGTTAALALLNDAVKKGGVSFWLAFIRQLCLNIPLLLLLHSLYGMTGLVWTQAVADLINVLISYVIYYFVRRRLDAGIPGSAVHLT